VNRDKGVGKNKPEAKKGLQSLKHEKIENKGLYKLTE